MATRPGHGGVWLIAETIEQRSRKGEAFRQYPKFGRIRTGQPK
ncbi:MAG TPA: hypothetical protein VMC83_19705 [Streptosporangiaceae bacterium]|nr:hypothetical protein [Streptosporangiaceae bacterium]